MVAVAWAGPFASRSKQTAMPAPHYSVLQATESELMMTLVNVIVM